ncbi:hypothetical protein M406DRAFT_286587 [Cryphonectria parasitica EP155]|uniref:N-acetyltransferase domain-containing protein n=1 Tax=Cryphonectria parasitica (strain ATCC 38755 / EP155) TaxID=660469 RepID=A0A9P5CRV6_CRYP1|nr:uncharacterized protein M406DRAFT_286587 [Cryphonectria parasitica EP155]KAF3768648.1 hypothetical protein M406DRAFT_286587 [Cryphonectria parasitica EP155]
MADPFIVDQPITTQDVVFTRADETIRRLAWRLNGEAWAAPLDIDTYLDRETHLSSQALTKDDRCLYWILAHKDDGTHIVASCESIKKTVYIAGKGTGVNDGFVETTGYAIASVYTNPKYRRLGMAAYMLRKLQEYVDAESECSALYSDIGRIYYSNLGWSVFPSEQVTIFLHQDQFPLPEKRRARYLSLQELPALCEKDVAALKARFRRFAADHTRTHVAFAPDHAQISWQLARETFVTKWMFNRGIENRGAITHCGRSWVYWDHDWREKKLKVLRFVFLDVSPETGEPVTEEHKAWDVVELLQAAAAEAAAWGLKQVLVWNPDEVTTKGVKGFHDFHEKEVDVVFEERHSSIPSFRWKEGKSTADTVWEDNYYYAWS